MITLTVDLIPSAYRLSTQAGWNQTPDDWARLLRVSPGGVKVWTDDGEVRAACSVIGYARRVGWIGMILVDEGYRGRGLGKIAFDVALKTAREHEFAVVGLDATTMGEPIYTKFGFQATVPVVRWAGTLQSNPSQQARGVLLRGLQDGLLDFDRFHSGEDRSALIRDLADTAEVFCLKQGDEIIAWAAVRPGRTALQIGPVVANSAETFSLIFAHLAIEFSAQNALCDLLQPDAATVLTQHGLQPSRALKRMTSPRQMDCLCGDGVWCGAGFEWG
jgi:GNAT superfamily N-acetyltransferase